ncbi:hypothetical protein QN277_026033 [Acacia crassicarpa]|uniref:Mitochondrial adenine nucleotide transporter BTL3 n=1 Tax=Acacia crassicarpa TaxID=499986 RepID=A0AAE1J9Y1_9FABA|nr:hypothetical protein QN277_026033 [Acacia crassicarpa]
MSHHLIKTGPFDVFLPGGLFLDIDSAPASVISLIASKTCSEAERVSCLSWGRRRTVAFEIFRRERRASGTVGCGFLSLSLSINGSEGDQSYAPESQEILGQHEDKVSDRSDGCKEKEDVRMKGSGAMNMTKHLWAGAVAAMVSRTFVAPLERLKLEYIVRGEQKNLSELIKEIATSQGLKGAAAGITATLLCLPMDTIRTVMVAPGGEALGGIIGAFRHMIKNEGFFSLYKGLVPSIVSMAPSGAVFYGVYDILKSAYLHSPEGVKRVQHMKEQAQELNAMEQMELGPIRTLLYGAIAGCAAEAATYPFEVVRRQLQMQVRATRMNALATCVKIVENGGVPALYAGLIPSLLQVLPSAAISYFVYEFMKIVLKVE